MPVTLDELALARQAGRLEAEAFDRRLRDVEQRQREERLGRLAPTANAASDANHASDVNHANDASVETPQAVRRLQQDVARLAAFHQAVQRSRAWRVVQWVRRPLGRAW